MEWQLLPESFVFFQLALWCVLILATMESLHIYIKLSPAQLIQYIFPVQQQRLMQLMGIARFPFFNFMLVWLVIFAASGYFFQLVCFYYVHHFINPFWLLLPSIFLTTLLSSALAHWLNQLSPDNTRPTPQSYREINLLGRVATIYKGIARPGSSAQARVRDELGHLHHIEVEPEFGELQLHSEIILFGKHESIYLAKLLPDERAASQP